MLTRCGFGNLRDQVTYSDRYSGLESGRDLMSPSRKASRQKSAREPFERRADDINAQFGLPKDLTCAERFRLRKALCVSIILMAAATVGVGSWGIYVSVESTEQAVPEFWNVFGQVQDIADRALGLLSQLGSVVTETEANLSTVIENRGEIQSLASSPAIQQVFGTANPLSQLVNELDPVMTVLRDIKQPIQEAANVSNGTFIAGFSEFREDFQPPTLAFQDTWRFVAIGVGFGLLILFALLSSALTVWARFPRLGSTCTILLWAMVALLMFLGAGVLSGVKVRRWLLLQVLAPASFPAHFSTFPLVHSSIPHLTPCIHLPFQYVTEDGCLYAESFVLNFATKQITGDVSEYAIKAINYYVDQSGTNEYVPGQALTQIVDPLAAQLLALSQQPAVDSVIKSLPTALQSPLLQADTTASVETKAALEGLASQIPVLQQLLLDVDRTASRSNVNPLFVSTKEYLCCSLSSDISDLFDAWVATGVLSLVLVILTTIRLVTFVREWYPASSP